jgi:hypothetical protein
VVDSEQFPLVRPGHIALQMHARDAWIEFKDIRVRRL